MRIRLDFIKAFAILALIAGAVSIIELKEKNKHHEKIYHNIINILRFAELRTIQPLFHWLQEIRRTTRNSIRIHSIINFKQSRS